MSSRLIQRAFAICGMPLAYCGWRRASRTVRSLSLTMTDCCFVTHACIRPRIVKMCGYRTPSEKLAKNSLQTNTGLSIIQELDPSLF
jgi:hypothetical protein